MSEKLSDHKYRDWLDSASKELKEKDLQDLNWQTPEGIEVKPRIQKRFKNLNHKIGYPGLPLSQEDREPLCIQIDHGQLDNMPDFQLLRSQISFIRKD